MSEIFWVVGIVDAHGAVHSVIVREDAEDLDVTHEELFGLHGTRWRSIGRNQTQWYPHQPTDDERFAVFQHLERLYNEEDARTTAKPFS